MDRQSNFVALASNFTAFANEDFLVTLANKGLYKRAVKDYEAVQHWNLDDDGDQLMISWEEVKVTLRANVAQSVCSCPSKTVCKHVIMAIQYAANYAGKDREREGAAEAADPIEDPVTMASSQPDDNYAQLRQIDFNTLRKQTSKKMYEEALQLVLEGWVAEFTEGDMLAAFIRTDGITVYFPKVNSIDHAICKCGVQGICAHKLVAILSYAQHEGLLNKEHTEENDFQFLDEEKIALLETVHSAIVDVFERGVMSCGEQDIEMFTQFAVKLESVEIRNLARMFRSLSVDVEHMLTKHAAFNQLTVMSTLSRLSNTVRLILKHKQNLTMLPLLIEGHRSSYYTIPRATLIGLGAYPWKTRSGYAGVTVLLYHMEKNEVCTYTVTMADYYEKTKDFANKYHIEALMKSNDHWSNLMSLNTLSGNCMKVSRVKMNKQQRVSSSKQTTAEVFDLTKIHHIQDLPIVRHDLEELEHDYQSIEYDYFHQQLQDKIVIIPFKQIINLHFDRTNQILTFELVNDKEQSVIAGMAYSELNETAIRYFERIANKNLAYNGYMVCRIYRTSQEFALTPISLIRDAGVYNFYFE